MLIDMLSIVMLTGMLSIVMLTGIMPSVVVLTVVAPTERYQGKPFSFDNFYDSLSVSQNQTTLKVLKSRLTDHQLVSFEFSFVA